MPAQRSGFVGGIFAVAVALATAPASAQCTAPASWFPRASTPPPGTADPGKDNCKFHQWAWQNFLWLTQTVGGDLRFITQLYSRGDPKFDNLFSLEQFHGGMPQWSNDGARGPLRLRARDTKPISARGIKQVNQAGDNGILIDQQNHAVYFAIHVNQTYYDFVRNRGYYIPQNLVAAPPTEQFPVGSLEVKSSWRIVNPGEPTDRFYTTSAEIRRLKIEDGKLIVDPDPTQSDVKTVALVGLHVAGVIEGHGEFVWATFEQQSNAPQLPQNLTMSSPDPVSNAAATFYAANTPANKCNLSNGGSVTLIDAGAQTLSPITQVVREIAWGGGTDTALVQSLNQSVHNQLGGDIAANYNLIGSLWIKSKTLQFNTAPGPPLGSVSLSNTTMETSRQSLGNCFSCHDTRKYNDEGVEFGPKNLNLSHALRRAYVINFQFQNSRARVPKAPTK